MILGNSFFSFIVSKFNSEQLLFFLIGIFIGIVISIFIFLIMIKGGKKEIVKKDIDVEWKNNLILSHQQSFKKNDGTVVELIGYLKDELYEMIYEIASKMNEDSKRPMLEISFDNIINGVDNITDRLYKLLDNFTYEINSSQTSLKDAKVKWYEEDIEKYNEELKIKNDLLEEVKIKIKNKNIGLINRFRKKYDSEYNDYLICEKNLKLEIKNIEANLKNINKELEYIKADSIHNNKILDKIIEKNKDRILDVKFKTILKEEKNENVILKKESFMSNVKSAVKGKIVNSAIDIMKNVLGFKEIFSNFISIVADEVCEIYR